LSKIKYKAALETLIEMTSDSENEAFEAHLFQTLPLRESALLLTDSYRGTTDWEDGDDEVVAEAELRATIDGKYGEFLGRSSFSISDVSGRHVAQIVLAELDGEATILFLYSHPDFQKRGFASHLIGLSARALLNNGYVDLYLYVTEGNPAERLYQSLGFGRVGRGLAE
jgi:ribosomal protein S18 acetylase RimI-like enzyme